MDKDTVIKVENMSKKFCRSLKRSMFYGSVDVAKNMLGVKVNTENLRKDEFWALDDISFELKKGEALGIIGKNGSGKTTLLRLLNGIFPPDKGKISLRGRMGALIAVGAGFHPHMSGRENIFLNGTILGMTKEEIKRKYHEIVDFADIGKFIDAPVATYSSGMTVRLGFSIAIHCTPEILLADEVLAVGDLSFVLKCYRKIAEYRDQGGSIILVSHGMQLVRNTCQKVMWLDHGKVKDLGNAREVCDRYEDQMMKKDSQDNQGMGVHINNDSLIGITKVEFLNKENESVNHFKVGDFFKMRIRFDCKRKLKNPIFTAGLFSTENVAVFVDYSNLGSKLNIDYIYGEGSVDLCIENLYIKAGNYQCTVTVAEGELINIIDWHEKSFHFSVASDQASADGLLQLPSIWKLTK